MNDEDTELDPTEPTEPTEPEEPADPIAEAIEVLRVDAAVTYLKGRATDEANAAAAAAVHAAEVAAAAEASAIAKQNRDLDATLALVERTYRVQV